MPLTFLHYFKIKKPRVFHSSFSLHDLCAHFLQRRLCVARRERLDRVDGLVGEILRQRSRLLDAVAFFHELTSL